MTAIVTQPRLESRFTIVREDIERESLRTTEGADCWECERIIGQLNAIWDAVLALDDDVRLNVYGGNRPYDAELDRKIEELVRQWSAVAERACALGDHLVCEYGEIKGLDLLRGNLKTALGDLGLTECELRAEFLGLVEAARAEHRGGLTRPLLDLD